MEKLILAMIIVALLAGIVWAISSPRDLRDTGAKNVMTGAFYEMMDKDKQKAHEVVLEQSENKRMEEQKSGEDKERGTKGEDYNLRVEGNQSDVR